MLTVALESGLSPYCGPGPGDAFQLQEDLAEPGREEGPRPHHGCSQPRGQRLGEGRGQHVSFLKDLQRNSAASALLMSEAFTGSPKNLS